MVKFMPYIAVALLAFAPGLHARPTEHLDKENMELHKHSPAKCINNCGNSTSLHNDNSTRPIARCYYDSLHRHLKKKLQTKLNNAFNQTHITFTHRPMDKRTIENVASATKDIGRKLNHKGAKSLFMGGNDITEEQWDKLDEYAQEVKKKHHIKGEIYHRYTLADLPKTMQHSISVAQDKISEELNITHTVAIPYVSKKGIMWCDVERHDSLQTRSIPRPVSSLESARYTKVIIGMSFTSVSIVGFFVLAEAGNSFYSWHYLVTHIYYPFTMWWDDVMWAIRGFFRSL